ncbi:hypothetical protein CDAR_14281 [Caerostris darwini]|uniref:Uncharacterized protein n=1 Tax=Caerostris darwini TaxID=1538125 RepID=A0AAV4QFG1_9ARAC|nr:hypothetical protein CDAR_14281 [Caerostris darwini]
MKIYSKETLQQMQQNRTEGTIFEFYLEITSSRNPEEPNPSVFQLIQEFSVTDRKEVGDLEASFTPTPLFGNILFFIFSEKERCNSMQILHKKYLVLNASKMT